MDYYCIELMKVISHTKNNDRVLNDCLLTWGNHDFFSIKKYDDDTIAPIEWLKKQHEKSRLPDYNGIEHQPVYLCSNNTNLQIVEQIIDGDFVKSKDTILVISMFQMDFLIENARVNGEELEEIIASIDQTVINFQKNNFRNDHLYSKSFFNLGESDFVVLFMTNKVEAAIEAISEIQNQFEVIKNYSIIVLPYTYTEICDPSDEIKQSMKEKLYCWLEKRNHQRYELMTDFVVDKKYLDLLNTKNETLQKSMSLVFGDHDVHLTTNSDVLIENVLSLASRTPQYRYSKTTPILDIYSYRKKQVDDNEEQ